MIPQHPQSQCGTLPIELLSPSIHPQPCVPLRLARGFSVLVHDLKGTRSGGKSLSRTEVSGSSDQRANRVRQLSICMGGNFIERHAAVPPQPITKGKRRFRAYCLSRISIRLSLNYRCVSNHIDNVITFKLGIFCIPLPWVYFLLF